MLYIVNQDAPGFIGRLGSTLGEAQVNIGTFHLGRRNQGGEAVLLLRSEEHTSELQSLMRISYAVFCLKKKNRKHSTQRSGSKRPQSNSNTVRYRIHTYE